MILLFVYNNKTMSRLFVITSFIFLTFVSCQPNTSHQRPAVEDKSQDTELHRQSGITFLEGGLIHKMEKKSGITDTIFISVHKPDSAHIILESPTNTANIRIGQLFSPNGSADGPFGKVLEYRFKDTGQYYITVSENLMVGDHYNGAYQVRIINGLSK